MKEKAKLKLEDIEVESFLTSLDSNKTVGGSDEYTWQAGDDTCNVTVLWTNCNGAVTCDTYCGSCIEGCSSPGALC